VFGHSEATFPEAILLGSSKTALSKEERDFIHPKECRVRFGDAIPAFFSFYVVDLKLIAPRELYPISAKKCPSSLADISP
jgi:hypothetical protein